MLGGSVSSNAQVDSAANISSTYSTGRRPWAPRYTLRGHFDGIRSVAFHPTERAVYTAGEDGCVMLWNLLKTGPPGSVCFFFIVIISIIICMCLSSLFQPHLYWVMFCMLE